MSVALLWKLKWFYPTCAAPHLWRLNTNQNVLLAACGILLSGIVGALLLRAMGVSTESPLPSLALLVALVAGSLTTITVFLVLIQISRGVAQGSVHEHVSKASTNRVVTNIAVGVIGFLIVWPLIQMTSALGGAIQFVFTGVRAPMVGHQFLETIREQGNNPVTWGLVFTIVILGPLAEEIIWRGAIQQGLKQIGLPRAAAILITATLFALVHWGAVPEYGRAAAIPALAVFGVALGVLMERTGRLWSSFIAHALFNCANLFLFSMLPK